MKKVLIFTLSILLLANIAAAANKPAKISTTVGVIKSIDMNNQSFVMEKSGLMRFLYAFIGLFGSKKSTDITVITTTESDYSYFTEFKKKTTEGVANGVFTDLAVNQRVQVKGTYITGQTTTTISTSTSTTTTIITTSQPKMKATSVFILTPVQAALKKCQTDTDCAWCGTNCLKKDSNVDRICIQISPPEGYNCKCINNVCKKVSVTTTTTSTSTSTTTTIDKTCQEACIAKGHITGICRQWTVTLKAKFGCNKNETEIGQTKDCTTVVNGQPLLGIGKTCCCSKEKLETTD